MTADRYPFEANVLIEPHVESKRLRPGLLNAARPSNSRWTMGEFKLSRALPRKRRRTQSCR